MAAAEVREAVERHPEVEAAYTVAGEASAILHVRARDTAHLEETLERIRDHPGMTRTQTQIVLSTLFERPFEEPPTGVGTSYVRKQQRCSAAVWRDGRSGGWGACACARWRYSRAESGGGARGGGLRRRRPRPSAA